MVAGFQNIETNRSIASPTLIVSRNCTYRETRYQFLINSYTADVANKLLIFYNITLNFVNEVPKLQKIMHIEPNQKKESYVTNV